MAILGGAHSVNRQLQQMAGAFAEVLRPAGPGGRPVPPPLVIPPLVDPDEPQAWVFTLEDRGAPERDRSVALERLVQWVEAQWRPMNLPPRVMHGRPRPVRTALFQVAERLDMSTRQAKLHGLNIGALVFVAEADRPRRIRFGPDQFVVKCDGSPLDIPLQDFTFIEWDQWDLNRHLRRGIIRAAEGWVLGTASDPGFTNVDEPAAEEGEDASNPLEALAAAAKEREDSANRLDALERLEALEAVDAARRQLAQIDELLTSAERDVLARMAPHIAENLSVNAASKNVAQETGKAQGTARELWRRACVKARGLRPESE